MIVSCLTESGQNVSKWVESNRLKLNADKTHILTLGTSARLGSICPLEVVIDVVRIQQSLDKSEQVLGIADRLFNSVVSYCLSLIGGCTKAEINSIQILQNKAAQLVTRSPPRSSHV